MNSLIKLAAVLAISFAKKKAPKLVEVKESVETSKTLMTDDISGSNTKLIYTFSTIQEKYDDESNVYTLRATIKLQDLNTVNFVDPKDSVRISVGWRNPQEDAYDVHSFEFKYFDKDPIATDGYCFGSEPTNQLTSDADVPQVGYRINGVYTGYNQNNKHNSTIKEWTDYITPQFETVTIGTDDVELEKNHRIYEAFNDITVISSSVSDRPKQVSADGFEVKQDFSVTYEKPFKPSGLTDINMKPMKLYNLTSAWGCYRARNEAIPGTDPDALFITNDNDVTVGCKGTWQSIVNALVYTDYADGVENFVAANKPAASSNLDPIPIEGVLEKQITVLLLDNAMKMASAVMVTASVFVSAF